MQLFLKNTIILLILIFAGCKKERDILSVDPIQPINIKTNDTAIIDFVYEATGGYKALNAFANNGEIKIEKEPEKGLTRGFLTLKYIAPTQSCTDTVNLTIQDQNNLQTSSNIIINVIDIRDEVMGVYDFRVLEITYNRTENDDFIIITDYDSLIYNFTGKISKYQTDKILIEYSDQAPLLGCSFNQYYGCSGDSLSECILNCPDTAIDYLKYMVTAKIVEEENLEIFNPQYRIYGSGNFEDNYSLVYLQFEYPEKMYGWEHIIRGKRVE